MAIEDFAAEPATAATARTQVRFSRPLRFVVRAVLFLALIGFLGYILQAGLIQAFMTNPGLNGLILGALFVGCLIALRELWRIHSEARAATDFDEVAQVPGGIGRLRRADQHQVDRSPVIDVVVDSQDRAVVGQRRVEAGEGFVGARVAALQEVGVARARFAQGAGDRQQLDAGKPMQKVGTTVELRRKNGVIDKGTFQGFAGTGTNRVAVLVSPTKKSGVPLVALDPDSRIRLDLEYREAFIRHLLNNPQPAEKPTT